MRNPMSLQDLKDLFASGVPGKFKPQKATQKGFEHKHNPARKPKAATLTPAQWHRMKRGQPAPYNHRSKKEN